MQQKDGFFPSTYQSPLPYHRQIYNNSNFSYMKPSSINPNINIQKKSQNKWFKPIEEPLGIISEKPIISSEESVENPGNSLTDFKIVQELGKGSYGIVYKARSLLDKKEYVIKQIDLKILNAKHRKESLQEVQLLKRLNHPNMIKYYNSFMEKDILFIVMEYAEGGDLQKLIKSKKDKREAFSEEEIWNLAYELISAVQHLHSNSIIHRDIKTLNIFLSKAHHIKLGDLGVSKIVSQAGVFEGTRVGTPLYLAPELVQNRAYDYKIDIWAIGCVLYHLANLEPPFIGENLISLGYNIVNKSAKPLNSVYSWKLSNFIMKLLEKNPAKRPKIFDLMRELETGQQKKGEKLLGKVEVANEKEYLLMRQNIIQEKDSRLFGISERKKKISEKNYEKIHFYNEKYLNNKEKNHTPLENNEKNNTKNHEMIINQNGNEKEEKEEKNNQDEKKNVFSEQIQIKNKKIDEDQQNFIYNEFPNNNSPKKTTPNIYNEEKPHDIQAILNNNYMDPFTFKSKEIKALDQSPIKRLHENNDNAEKDYKKENIFSKNKKFSSILELKNPKNLNVFYSQSRNDDNFQRLRPVSASFKPKIRSSENNLNLPIKQEKIKEIYQFNEEEPKIRKKQKKKPVNKENPTKDAANAGPSLLLLRPKSALLPYKGVIKPYDFTKKDEKNFICEETREIKEVKHLVRPQTAFVKGERDIIKKKLTIYDLLL